MKTIIFSILIFLLVSCAPQVTPSSAPDEVTSLPVTKSPVPSSTTNSSGDVANLETTKAPPSTETSAETEIKLPSADTTPPATKCILKLLAPADGIKLFSGQGVKFDWEDQPGATYYALLWAKPDGSWQQFQVPKSEFARNINLLPKEVSYKWTVLSYDSKNKLLCSSITRSLTLSSSPKKTMPATNSIPQTPSMVSTTPASTPTKMIPPTLPATTTASFTPLPTPTYIIPPTAAATPTQTPTLPEQAKASISCMPVNSCTMLNPSTSTTTWTSNTASSSPEMITGLP